MDYKTRRTRVMETMPQGSLALFFSGKAPVRSLDEARSRSTAISTI